MTQSKTFKGEKKVIAERTLLDWKRDAIIHTECGEHSVTVSFKVVRRNGEDEFTGELDRIINISDRKIISGTAEFPDQIYALVTKARTDSESELENQWHNAMTSINGIHEVIFV